MAKIVRNKTTVKIYLNLNKPRSKLIIFNYKKGTQLVISLRWHSIPFACPTGNKMHIQSLPITSTFIYQYVINTTNLQRVFTNRNQLEMSGYQFQAWDVFRLGNRANVYNMFFHSSEFSSGISEINLSTRTGCIINYCFCYTVVIGNYVLLSTW